MSRQIQRYDPDVFWNGPGDDVPFVPVLVPCQDGVVLLVRDLAPYVAEKVREAVEKEQKRLREHEVEPLMTALDMALFRLRNEYTKNGYFQDPDTDEHIYTTTLAAVRAAQQPPSEPVLGGDIAEGQDNTTLKARITELETTLGQVGVVLALHGIGDTAAEVAKALNPQPKTEDQQRP